MGIVTMTLQNFGKGGWTPERLGDLSGKEYVITGGNSGIGYEAASILLGKNASVTILCRNTAKAEAAVEQLKAATSNKNINWVEMDLASLASVKKAAAEIKKLHKKIDALILNAGLMMIPNLTYTEDGFETQFGVNHLGHFAFAAQLADLVTKADGRFVSVSSVAHKMGLKRMQFDDLNFKNNYSSTTVYAQSKLANIHFTKELNRRLQAAGSKSMAVVCHPGWSATNLQTTGPSHSTGKVMAFLNKIFAQKAELGSYPTLLAAADAEATGGSFYGPSGLGGMSGAVQEVKAAAHGYDDVAAAQLWTVSEEMTGVSWKL
jgi:NAD(P)-dependent dehydrogenase (short-subunit alcohol dehydrogenase family)